ncbi:sugar-binding protein [Marinicellulosiphila megalodicopiae]|uniref:sugar-binding protein n=1 Tax=Marinicellulosiphila megalodicopiae TaxID=2724896 RepID=UPI003BAFE15E
MLKHLSLLFVCFALNSCDTVNQMINPEKTPTNSNQAPTIEIETQINVLSGKKDSITFTASDSDGSIKSVTATQQTHLDFPIDANIINNTLLILDVPESKIDRTVTFLIITTDNENKTDQTQIFVSIKKSEQSFIPPTLLINESVTAKELSTVVINIEAYDEDGTIEQYLWKQSEDDLIQLHLSDPTLKSNLLIFTAPEVTTDTQFNFELTITDNDQLTAKANTVITILFQAKKPSVSLDTFYTFNELEQITINSTSADTDGSIVNYQWAQDASDTIQLNLSNSILNQQHLVFDAIEVNQTTELHFSLTVTDNDGLTNTATTLLNIAQVNIEPTIEAISDLSVDEITTHSISAIYADSNGSIISAHWTQTSGNPILFTDNANGKLTFSIPDISLETEYQFTFTVKDNDNQTASKTITITANPVTIIPLVMAPENMTTDELSVVTLLASSLMDQSQIQSVNWTQISGTMVNLITNNLFESEFIAPNVMETETLEFQVELIDIDGGSITDTVNVTVNNLLEQDTLISSVLINIVDDELKQCINDLNLTYTNELTTLNCSTLSVNNTTGLDAFENLTSIRFDNHNLNNTDNTFMFADHNAISTIVLSNNALTEINTTNMQSIVHLDLSSNPISVLSFDYLVSLQSINLNNTDFSCNQINALITQYPNVTFTPTFTNCNDQPPVLSNSYSAPKTVRAPIIDGVMDSQLWDEANWQSIGVIWEGNSNDLTPDDFSGKFKVIWDENALYMLFDIIDDSLDSSHEYFFNDTVELFIDEDHSGGDHNGYNSDGNAFAYHIGLDGRAIDIRNGSPITYSDEHITSQIISNGTHHTWEVRINIYDDTYNYDNNSANQNAEIHTPVTLYTGKELGFSASYIDNDGSSVREHFIGSVNSPGHLANQGYLNADGFGDLTLVDSILHYPVIEDIHPVTVNNFDEVSIPVSFYDTNGSVTDFYWSQTSGTTINFTSDEYGTLIFTAPEVTQQTQVTFTLTVTDNELLTTTKEVIITIEDMTTPLTISLNNEYQFLATSTVNISALVNEDTDNLTSILWTQTSGDLITIDNDDFLTLSFDADEVYQTSSYGFNLTVMNSDHQTASKDIVITINPLTYVFSVDAGQDISADENTLINLTGQSSLNLNEILSVKWTQTSGIATFLTTNNQLTTSFMTPESTSQEIVTFELSVTHLSGQSITDSIEIISNNTDPYLLLTSDAAEQVTDQNLKACLLNTNLSYALEITSLNCANQTVSSLEGLENFENLITLDLSNANIESLTINSSLALKELNISGNNINQLSFEYLSELKILNIQNNNFTHFTNTNLINLTELNISENAIGDLDWLDFPVLESLDVSNTLLNCEDILAIKANNPSMSVLPVVTQQTCDTNTPLAQSNTYNAYKTGTPPVIDGIIDDNAWNVSQWQVIDVLWLNLNEPTPEDFTGKFKVIWDEGYLYMLFEIIDDKLIAGHDHTYDTVEIFLDEDKSGGTVYESGKANAFAYHLPIENAPYSPFGTSVALPEEHISKVLLSTGNTHIWEIKIQVYSDEFNPYGQPHSPIDPEVLYENKVLGFTASYNDSDTGGNREHFIGSVDSQGHTNNEGYLNADGYGTLNLLVK